MIEYQRYKKKRFLQNLNSFALITFLSNTQLNFISIKNLLNKNNMTIKVIKSKSISNNINTTTYLNKKNIHIINNLSKCSIFIIQNKYLNTDIFKNLKKINRNLFTNKKMYLLAIFDKNKIFNSNLLFNLVKEKLYKSIYPTITKNLMYFLFYLNFNSILIFKMLLVYNSITE